MAALHFLVVYPEGAEFIKEVLDEAGHHVTCCRDADEATNRFERVSADVLIVDVSAEGASEMLRTVRQKNPDLEIAFVISAAEAGPTSPVWGAGAADARFAAFDYLRTPIDQAAPLTALANRVTDKRALREENRRLYESVQAEREALQRVGAEVMNLYNCTRWITSTLDLKRVLQIAADGLSQLSGGRTVHVFQLEARDRRLEGVSSSRLGVDAITAMRVDFPADHELEHLEAAPSWTWFVRWLQEVLEATHVDVLPIASPGEVFGVAAILDDTNGLTDASTDILTQFALQIATAVGNARYHASVEELSLRDVSTGLYTHQYFHERMANEIVLAARNGHALSLLLLGVDRLHEFNHVHGHREGDVLLRRIAIKLEKELRGSDLAARYFGDVFGVILPQTPKAGAIAKAERLVVAIAESDLAVTLSIAAASYPDDGREERTLLDNAEAALRRAKEAGGNRVEPASAILRLVGDTEGE